jgi:Putative regulator of cell autolysis
MKKPWYSEKWVTVLLHAAAWVFLFSLPYLLRPSLNAHPKPSQNNNGNSYFSWIMNVTWVGLFYLNAFFLIPRLIYKKKYWLYTLSTILIFTWLIAQTWILFQFFMNPADYNIRMHILFSFFVFLFILASSTAYQMINDRIKTERITKEKETENLKTELSFLRSQVSPHFMFNVLNNMVALARKQSEELEPSLIKLSSLLRYMLYETDEDKVDLEREIDYLQSYIDLQRQRFGKKVVVNVLFQKDELNYSIEPMLLIPFVENAFKHGTGMIENAQIDIDLSVKNGLLQFCVRNKFNDTATEVKDKTSGIGLNNVQRRLNLLYKDHHNVLINKKDGWFSVSLQLNLH